MSESQPVLMAAGINELQRTLEVLAERARLHQVHAVSDRTRHLYRQDWNEFAAWCARMGLVSLPATSDTVVLFMSDLASQVTGGGLPRLKPSSIARRKASIASAHRSAGFASPTADDRVNLVMRGIRRDGDATVRRMRPLLLVEVSQVLNRMEHDTWPGGVKAARDTVILLFGFAGALRRSSLAAINTADIQVSAPDGLHLRLPFSKTDQAGEGHTLALPYGHEPATCPPCAWARWSVLLEATTRAQRMRIVLDYSTAEHICRTGSEPALQPGGPVFRQVNRDGAIGSRSITAQTCYRMLKARMRAAGLNSDQFGFHSLRAGFVTQARRNGATARDVRRQTLHSSDAMVDLYDREYNPLVGGNAVTALGL